ncbi:hypothetical protein [Hymenobacter sp. 102]|uniref:hypothetical protein n=1 Tax=Hymenobacter sp. 102 TaxID=3403152 RepID=UPI003CF74F45
MLRTAFLGLLLTTATATVAQTTPTRKPAPTHAASRPQPASAKTASDGQGEYVAPDMTGAPNDRVTTDYSNRPLKKSAKGTSTLSSQPKSAPANKQ